MPRGRPEWLALPAAGAFVKYPIARFRSSHNTRPRWHRRNARTSIRPEAGISTAPLPNTAAGKAIARRNALRHGLAALVHKHPLLSAEIEGVAEALGWARPSTGTRSTRCRTSYSAPRSPARSIMPATSTSLGQRRRLKRSVLFIGRVRREMLKYFVVMTRCEFIRR